MWRFIVNKAFKNVKTREYMNQRSRNIIHQFTLLISQHELSCRVNQQLSSILRYTWLATKKKYLGVIVLQYSLNSSFRLFTSYMYIIGRNPSLRVANFWHVLKTNCTLILTKHNSLNHFLGSQYSGFWYQKKKYGRISQASKPFTSSFIFFFFVTDGLLYWSSELRLYFAIITSVKFIC